jgi:uncharacterized damage-inducible protein DinB
VQPSAADRESESRTASPLSAYNRVIYEGVKMVVLRAAEKMPAESYDFRPADSVRGFGQIIGHVADSQYIFASLVLGESNPAPRVEKTKSTKNDLIAALRGAFVYSDRAYEGLTDATAAEVVEFFGGDAPILGPLTANIAHMMGHYGNLVTYMRMKDIVPPTSEPGFLPEAKK